MCQELCAHLGESGIVLTQLREVPAAIGSHESAIEDQHHGFSSVVAKAHRVIVREGDVILYLVGVLPTDPEDGAAAVLWSGGDAAVDSSGIVGIGRRSNSKHCCFALWDCRRILNGTKGNA